MLETEAGAHEWIAAALSDNKDTDGEQVSAEGRQKVAADKGCHRNPLLRRLRESGAMRCIPEPERGRRNWQGTAAVKKAAPGNRRWVRGAPGKWLTRRRDEYRARSLKHLEETGAMRPTH